MRETILSIFILLMTSSSVFSQEKKDDNSDFQILKGPYVGQKTPGMIPEIFAPGIISTDKNEHGFPAFSPKGDEVFWSVYNDKGDFQTIYYMKRENNIWTKPQIAWFSGKFTEGTPSFNISGNKLFFSSFRSNNGLKTKTANIWFLEKLDNQWIGPKKLGLKLNTENMEFFPYLVKNDVMYLQGTLMGAQYNFGIYRSEFIDGEYTKPTLLGEAINTKHLDWTACVDPNETFLIFASNRPGTHGSSDLHICFKQPNGAWSAPKNMGASVNTEKMERFPGLSPDGKYLFFIRGFGDVYWVDAKIIDNLRPEKLKE